MHRLFVTNRCPGRTFECYLSVASRYRAEQTLHISPVLISEGLTSVCEAVRAGLGVAVLPDWMIQVDLLPGRLERVLPQWNPKDVPVHVVYAGARSIADARARFRRLRRQLHEERIRIQGGALYIKRRKMD